MPKTAFDDLDQEAAPAVPANVPVSRATAFDDLDEGAAPPPTSLGPKLGIGERFQAEAAAATGLDAFQSKENKGLAATGAALRSLGRVAFSIPDAVSMKRATMAAEGKAFSLAGLNPFGEGKPLEELSDDALIETAAQVKAGEGPDTEPTINDLEEKYYQRLTRGSLQDREQARRELIEETKKAGAQRLQVQRDARDQLRRGSTGVASAVVGGVGVAGYGLEIAAGGGLGKNLVRSGAPLLTRMGQTALTGVRAAATNKATAIEALRRGVDLSTDKGNVDASGEFVVTEPGDPTMLALTKGTAGAAAEMALELGGGGLVSMPIEQIAKFTGRTALRKIVGASLLSRIGASKIGQAGAAVARGSKNLNDIAGIAGPLKIEEYVEEYLQNTVDNVVGLGLREGSQEFDKTPWARLLDTSQQFADKDQMKDMFLSFLLVQGAHGGVGLTQYFKNMEGNAKFEKKLDVFFTEEQKRNLSYADKTRMMLQDQLSSVSDATAKNVLDGISDHAAVMWDRMHSADGLAKLASERAAGKFTPQKVDKRNISAPVPGEDGIIREVDSVSGIEFEVALGKDKDGADVQGYRVVAPDGTEIAKFAPDLDSAIVAADNFHVQRQTAEATEGERRNIITQAAQVAAPDANVVVHEAAGEQLENGMTVGETAADRPGWYDNGKDGSGQQVRDPSIHVVMPNIKSGADLMRLMFHEGNHYGLDLLAREKASELRKARPFTGERGSAAEKKYEAEIAREAMLQIIQTAKDSPAFVAKATEMLNDKDYQEFLINRNGGDVDAMAAELLEEALVEVYQYKPASVSPWGKTAMWLGETLGKIVPGGVRMSRYETDALMVRASEAVKANRAALGAVGVKFGKTMGEKSAEKAKGIQGERQVQGALKRTNAAGISMDQARREAPAGAEEGGVAREAIPDDVTLPNIEAGANEGGGINPATGERFSRPSGVNIEVAPNPADIEKSTKWNRMSYPDRDKATRQIAGDVIPALLKNMGINGVILDYTVGGYVGQTAGSTAQDNPSIIMRFPKGMSYADKRDAGIVVGALLRQEPIVTFDENVTTGENLASFVKVTTDTQMTEEQKGELYRKLWEAFPSASGFTARDGAMVFGNFSDLSDAQFHDGLEAALNKIAPEIPFDTNDPSTFMSELIGDLGGQVDTDKAAELDKLSPLWYSVFKKRSEANGTQNRTAQAGRDDLRRWVWSFNTLQARTDKALQQQFKAWEFNNQGTRFARARADQRGDAAELGSGAKAGREGLRSSPRVAIPAKLWHWTGFQGELSETDPSRQGKGRAGAELRRKYNNPKHYVPRTWFEGDIYKRRPEFPELRLYSADVDLSRIVRLDEETWTPELHSMWKRASRLGGGDEAPDTLTYFEEAAKKAGYLGVYDASRDVYCIFEKVKVTPAAKVAPKKTSMLQAVPVATAKTSMLRMPKKARAGDDYLNMDDWDPTGLSRVTQPEEKDVRNETGRRDAGVGGKRFSRPFAEGRTTRSFGEGKIGGVAGADIERAIDRLGLRVSVDVLRRVFSGLDQERARNEQLTKGRGFVGSDYRIPEETGPGAAAWMKFIKARQIAALRVMLNRDPSQRSPITGDMLTKMSAKTGDRGGAESIVGFDMEKKLVYKDSNGQFHKDWLSYLNRLALHSLIFPESSYKFLGWADVEGELRPIVQQPFIAGEKLEETDLTRIQNVMISKGFIPIPKQNGDASTATDFIHMDGGLLAEDLHVLNAKRSPSGEIIVFDPAIFVTDGKPTPEQIAPYADELPGGKNHQETLRFARAQENKLRVVRTRQELMADVENNKDSADWYTRHKGIIARIFKGDANLFQDLLAITSQRASVASNVTLALKAYKQWMMNEEFSGYIPPVRSNLTALKDGAKITGLKIGQYGAALEGDKNAVTVDRWMVREFFATNGDSGPAPNESQRAKLVGIVRDIAEKTGYSPRQVQAMLWAAAIRRDQKARGKQEHIDDYQKQLERREADGSLQEQLAGIRGPDWASSGDQGSEGEGGRRSAFTGAQDDGVRFSRAAPIESPEFKAWFKDSKVVDADGKPMVVYHGTNDESYFQIFNTSNGYSYGPGAYFTPSESHADNYAMVNGEVTGRIISAYLSIQNPLIVGGDGEFMDIAHKAAVAGEYPYSEWKGQGAQQIANQIARKRGHDGIIKRWPDGQVIEIVAFRPEQIKSAEPVTRTDRGRDIETAKRFDASNPDIRYARSEDRPESELESEAYMAGKAPLKLVKVRDDGDMETYSIPGTHLFKTPDGDIIAASHEDGQWDMESVYNGDVKTFDEGSINNPDALKRLADELADSRSQLVSDAMDTLIDIAESGAEGDAWSNEVSARHQQGGESAVSDYKYIDEVSEKARSMGMNVKFARAAIVPTPTLADTYAAANVHPNEAKSGVRSWIESVGKKSTLLIAPLSTRLGMVHPDLKIKAVDMERTIGRRKKQWGDATLKLQAALHKLSPADNRVVTMALRNGDQAIIQDVFAHYNLPIAEYQTVRDMLDEVEGLARDVGISFGHAENYFPSQVRDYVALKEHMAKHYGIAQDVIEKALAQAIERNGGPLTEWQEADVLSGMISGLGQSGSAKPGNLKARGLEQVPADLIQYYDRAESSLQRYVDAMVELIGQRELLGKMSPDYRNLIEQVHKMSGFGGNAADDPDVIAMLNPEFGIGRVAVDLHMAGLIDADKAEALKGILATRFKRPARAPVLSMFKTAAYMANLAQFRAAVRNIGDLTNAFIETGVSFAGPAMGKRLRLIPAHDGVTVTDLGIDSLNEEFKSGNAAQNALKAMLKFVLFTKTDKFGKNVLIQAKLDQMEALYNKASAGDADARRKLDYAMRRVFTEWTPAQEADLAAPGKNETKLNVAYHTLAEYTPISRLEMPEYYNKGGLGAMPYMYRSYLLKFWDAYHNRTVKRITDARARGDRAEAVAAWRDLYRFPLYFMAFNSIASFIINAMFDRGDDPEKIVGSEALNMMGISRYHTWKISQGEVQELAGGLLMPPLSMVGDAIRDMKDASDDKVSGPEDARSTRMLPVAGTFIYYWGGRGSQAWKEEHGRFKTEDDEDASSAGRRQGRQGRRSRRGRGKTE